MDFLDDTKDFKLIISNNKKYVVDYISSKKKLIKYKVMSLTEFRKRYYFDYDNKAVFFLMKKYNMKFANARMFIDNMENGILVPMSDKEALVEAMAYVADHVDEVCRISQNAMEIREKLAAEKIAGQWLELFEE